MIAPAPGQGGIAPDPPTGPAPVPIPAHGASARALVVWGDANRRDLPWRHTHDPWLVLVSEVMLQQTQVSRVVPKWEEFRSRFPTPAACAAAPLADVLVLWSGLGYPRRAANLHRCATALVDRHDGRVPEDLADLLALPGVGPYTARAVLAFAFEHDVGVVDTNVGRVLARVGGRRLTPARAQRAADAAVPPGAGWAWNQAMFDLGAMVCTKRSPGCDRCPLVRWCRWQRHGGPDPAEGSAGTSSRQGRFPGSDREARGQVLALLVEADRDRAEVVELLDARRPGTGHAVVAGLVADGLVDDDGGVLRLPGRRP